MAKKGQDTPCPVCGTVFYRFPSAIRRGRDFTCSRTCAARHFRDKGTPANCKTCGQQFYRRRSLAEKGYGNFCSQKCWGETRDNKVECVCLQCDTVFKKSVYAVSNQNGGRFCSRSCADKFKRRLRKRGEKNMFTNWQKREWMSTHCIECKSTESLELDHIKPRFAGGLATEDNAQTLCAKCNRKKFWQTDYPLYRDLLTRRALEC